MRMAILRRVAFPIGGGNMKNRKDLLISPAGRRAGKQKWPRRSGAKSWEEDTHLRAA
jgi:hypothetical protein